jgi:HSP20 family molecular chaperone IbpA
MAESQAMEETKHEVPVVDEIKYRIQPRRYFDYSCKNKDWELEIHLPGVVKSDIKLKFLRDAYIMEARRGEALYRVSEYVPFEIDKDSITANYENGLLKIKGKIKDPMAEAVEIKL